jgi:hypothetical protein
MDDSSLLYLVTAHQVRALYNDVANRKHVAVFEP